MYHYLSLGSNIQPELNISRAVSLLDEEYGIVWLSKFTYTEPVGMDTHHGFINALCIVRSDSVTHTRLKLIERQLGRDMDSPTRSTDDRPIDVDLLFSSETIDPSLFRQCEESYILACL